MLGLVVLHRVALGIIVEPGHRAGVHIPVGQLVDVLGVDLVGARHNAGVVAGGNGIGTDGDSVGLGTGILCVDRGRNGDLHVLTGNGCGSSVVVGRPCGRDQGGGVDLVVNCRHLGILLGAVEDEVVLVVSELNHLCTQRLLVDDHLQGLDAGVVASTGDGGLGIAVLGRRIDILGPDGDGVVLVENEVLGQAVGLILEGGGQSGLGLSVVGHGSRISVGDACCGDVLRKDGVLLLDLARVVTLTCDDDGGGTGIDAVAILQRVVGVLGHHLALVVLHRHSGLVGHEVVGVGGLVERHIVEEFDALLNDGVAQVDRTLEVADTLQVDGLVTSGGVALCCRVGQLILSGQSDCGSLIVRCVDTVLVLQAVVGDGLACCIVSVAVDILDGPGEVGNVLRVNTICTRDGASVVTGGKTRHGDGVVLLAAVSAGTIALGVD